MQITIKLHGFLREHRPPDSSGWVFKLSLADEATVGSVVEQLGIPQDALYLAFLEKQQVSRDTPVGDGDTLWLFPPIAGGQLNDEFRS